MFNHFEEWLAVVTIFLCFLLAYAIHVEAWHRVGVVVH